MTTRKLAVLITKDRARQEVMLDPMPAEWPQQIHVPTVWKDVWVVHRGRAARPVPGVGEKMRTYALKEASDEQATYEEITERDKQGIDLVRLQRGILGWKG